MLFFPATCLKEADHLDEVKRTNTQRISEGMAPLSPFLHDLIEEKRDDFYASVTLRGTRATVETLQTVLTERNIRFRTSLNGDTPPPPTAFYSAEDA